MFSQKSLSSALSPLLIVIAIGLILDGVEEIKRYRNDLQTNKTKVKVYKNKKLRDIEWKKVKIGNLIKVNKDENFPADMLVIYSSNKEGNFYLQTSNIDGETNLKERDALNYTQELFSKKNFKKSHDNLYELFKNKDETGNDNCVIEVEQPNKNIYEINGSMVFKGEEKNKNYFNFKSTAIRGAKLKNTKFIYGIIIYTGKDTKIMKNIVKQKVKSANIDKFVDNIVIVILILRIIYVIVFMILGMIKRYKYLPSYDDSDKNKTIYDYLFYYRHYKGIKENNDHLENLKFFTSHFICSNPLLPTSVILISAISKIIQSLFLENCEMPLREKDNHKMKSLSTELLADLGSVKYIFSDKTGTLTKNETQFKACSIFTYLFDEADGYDDKTNILSKMEINSVYTSSNNFSKKKSTASRTNFSSNFDINNIIKRLKLRNIPIDIKNIKGCPFKDQGEALEEFMFNMSLNHDILIENNQVKEENINYQGMNPDEITLVGAASELGYCFYGKNGNIIKIKRKLYNANGNEDDSEIRKFELLLKIPFESARQRSSVIVRDLKSNKIKIYNKGSDTKIFERLNEYSINNILEITKDHVNTFARRGLRTLCYSYKTITEKEWSDWSKEYNALREEQKINNLIGEKLELLYNSLEKDSFLLGATALEDQLQDGVKDDINQFIEAGINFWMLTGDKMDTAESIGYSIKLFDSDTEVFKIRGKNQEEIIERMKEIKDNITLAQKELSNFNINNEKGKKENVVQKVERLKLKVKNKIEDIYENENNNENGFDNNENKIEENNKHNNKNIKKPLTKRLKENGINYNKEEASTERLLQKKNIENYMEDKVNVCKKRDSIPNMSILKFMIDNQYFLNSDIDLENYTIIKGKVIKPEISFSEKSQNKENINGGNYEEKKEDNIENISFSNSIEIKQINKIEQKIDLEKNINRIKPNINPNENDIINDNIYNGNNICTKENQDTGNIVLNIEERNNNINNNNNDLSKTSKEIKKMQRKKINLPTKASTFLAYFEDCLEKAKETLILQQKAFTLFKIPYLYNSPNENILDYNNDNNSIKNYLFHTKVKYSLIIQGDSVNFCTSGEAADLFWFLILHSRSVICCRCSPIQKSKIVKFVKNNSKDLTLSIGDGENDVNMIKTAHIGIGIYGKEGSQAAYNADYAFNEFKYLKRLLFVNGRFILLRNSYLYNIFFSKNFIYTLQYLLFNFFSLYGGTFLFDEFYDSMFNTFITIISLVTYSCLEEDIDVDFNNYNKKEKEKMQYLLPDIYKQARDIKPLNIVRYCVITFLSLLISVIFHLFFCYIFKDMIKNKSGDITSINELSFFLYFSIVATHFFMMFLDTNIINYLTVIFYLAQIIADILFVIIMNAIDNDYLLSGIVGEVTNSPICFLASIAICGFICLCFFILRRAELYFGLNLVNLIKMNKLEAIYIGKYYRKKISQMIRAIRGIVKFKKIHKEMNNGNNKENDEYENLVDIKMKKVVQHYEIKKSKKIK